MGPPSTEIRAGLEALAAGDLDVGAARKTVRRALAEGGCLISEVYDALRYATWRMMRAREVPEDIVAWHDLYTHTAALLRRQERSDLAERLVALADLIAQTSRFVDRQPLEAVLGRQHVACLLAKLKEDGGKALRSALKDASGLADANLSRVLGILSAYGLIRRRRLGKEAEVELTEAGQTAVDAAGGGSKQRRQPQAEPAWWDDLDVPLALWAPSGELVGCTAAFRAVIDEAGWQGPGLPTNAAWRAWLKRVAPGDHPAAGRKEPARILRLGRDRSLLCSEKRLGDGSARVILIDLAEAKPSIGTSPRLASAGRVVDWQEAVPGLKLAAASDEERHEAARRLDELSKEVKRLRTNPRSDKAAMKHRAVAGRAGFFIKLLSASVEATPMASLLAPVLVAALRQSDSIAAKQG